MTDIAQTLDRIVPPYDGTGDWERVLRDAGLERRPRRLAAAPGGRRRARRRGDRSRRPLAVRHRAERDRPRAGGDRRGTGAPLRLRERPRAHPRRPGDRRADRGHRRAGGLVRPGGRPARDAALRGRRPVRRLPGRRRGLRAREHPVHEPRRRLPRGARVGPGRDPGRGRGRGNAGLLDQDRAEHPRRGRVPRDVRTGVHPRRPARGRQGSPGSSPTRRCRPAPRRSR